MLSRWFRFPPLLLLILVVGCSFFRTKAVDPKVDTRAMPPGADVKIGDWLELSRPDLVTKTNEWIETIKVQRDSIVSDPNSVSLLPKHLLPQDLPVFNAARYDAKAEISLPSYIASPKPDRAVALHLAKFGDHEAAMKFVDPGDAALKAQIVEMKYEKSYPLEWTRLVAYVLHSYEISLTKGEDTGVEAASTLVSLRTQLATVLDDKAKNGLLGQTLFSFGNKVLESAKTAWAEGEGKKKPLIARGIEVALKNTPATAAPQSTLVVGTPRSEIEAIFGFKSKGPAFVVSTPPMVARVLDLLGLPMPHEGASVVAAFLDKDDKLAEFLIGYRSKIEAVYPEPAQMLYRLTEQGLKVSPLATRGVLSLQSVVVNAMTCEVTRTNRNSAFGAMIEFKSLENPTKPAFARSLRDLGTIQFDSSFEANRLANAPKESGDLVSTKDPAVLGPIDTLLGIPSLESVILKRLTNYDLLDGADLNFPLDASNKILTSVLPALWTQFGPSVIGNEESDAKYLGMRWTQGNIVAELKIPYELKAPLLAVRDNHDQRKPEQIAAWAKVALERDEIARQARFNAGKPDERLPRALKEISGVSLPLRLGQSKAEVLEVMTKWATKKTELRFRQTSVPEGEMLTILTLPPPLAPYFGRTVLTRFDSDDKVVEIRARYQAGKNPPKGKQRMIESLIKSSAGEVVKPSWRGLYGDIAIMKAGKPAPIVAEERRWRDDKTLIICRQIASEVEVITRDRPQNDPSVTVPVWNFLPTGPKGLKLGATRADIETLLKEPQERVDDVDAYAAPSDSPFAVILITYNKEDKAEKIRAVHKLTIPEGKEKLEQDFDKAWSQFDLPAFGYPNYGHKEFGSLLLSNFWHDDTTRIRTAIEETVQGNKLITEWRRFPIIMPKPPVKKEN